MQLHCAYPGCNATLQPNTLPKGWESYQLEDNCLMRVYCCMEHVRYGRTLEAACRKNRDAEKDTDYLQPELQIPAQPLLQANCLHFHDIAFYTVKDGIIPHLTGDTAPLYGVLSFLLYGRYVPDDFTIVCGLIQWGNWAEFNSSYLVGDLIAYLSPGQYYTVNLRVVMGSRQEAQRWYEHMSIDEDLK